MSQQVLVVSRDAMLLQTRQLVLGAFFQVRGAGRVREAELLFETCRFDLVILCYTLSEAECRELIQLVQEQKHRARILMLTPVGFPPVEEGLGDATMSEAGPYYLLKKSAEMLGADLHDKVSLVHV